MKRLLNTFPIILALLGGCTVADYENSDMYNPEESAYSSDSDAALFNREVSAIFTIKQDAADVTFFQLDEDTRLYPGDRYPFYGQVRAMGSLRISAVKYGDYGYVTSVLWAEALDMGQVVTSLSGAADGIDISTSWMTSVEDGYLTVHYSCWWGNDPKHHDFYIVTGQDPSDPYAIELRHSSGGDAQDVYDEGLVYFDINGLPDTAGAEKELTLSWTGTNGEKQTRKFGFRTRK